MQIRHEYAYLGKYDFITVIYYACSQVALNRVALVVSYCNTDYG